jgi:small subunit ribosomal protein S8e
MVENLLKRKATGGRRHPHRGRRRYERDRPPIEPVVGKTQVVVRRVRGGGVKVALKALEWVSVSDPSTGKTMRARVLRLVKNPASRDYERRGVVTKGAVVETELGLVKITSRPSQHGVANGVLVTSR